DWELEIVQRHGQSFEGGYRANKARVVCEVKGTLTENSISWRVKKGVGGRVEFADSPFTGSISRDRIHVVIEHKTRSDQRADWKGVMIKDSEKSGPVKLEKSVSYHSDGRRKDDPTPNTTQHMIQEGGRLGGGGSGISAVFPPQNRQSRAAGFVPLFNGKD